MNARSAGIVIVILIVLGAGLLYITMPKSAPTTTTSPQQAQDEQAVRNQVATFGTLLKNVSLLSPDSAQQITSAYAQFVTPALLQAWVANPRTAPGRVASSPWPDHIDIDSVTPQGRVYRVIGNIVEITSADQPGQPAATIPAYTELTQVNGAWLISAWQEQPYTEN